MIFPGSCVLVRETAVADGAGRIESNSATKSGHCWFVMTTFTEREKKTVTTHAAPSVCPNRLDAGELRAFANRLIHGGEVGDGARDLEQTMIGAGGEAEALAGCLEQGGARLIEGADLSNVARS